MAIVMCVVYTVCEIFLNDQTALDQFKIEATEV
jgi:hypothetical protein